jgi:hypothetical protein
VFEVGGVIKLQSLLNITNPNITIAGQTAPKPGIMLRGHALRIGASDVLVQHLRVRVGDDPGGELMDNRDALRVESPAAHPIKNIIVDHCSFSWSVDEMASAYEGVSGFSLLNNIFADPLNDSFHSKGPHGYGVLIGGDRGNSVRDVSMIGNVLSNITERNPLTRATTFVMVNNLVYNRKHIDVSLQSWGFPTINTLVGNVFLRGPDYQINVKPIVVRSGDYLAVVGGSKVYVSDNKAVETTSDPWSVVSVALQSVKTSTVPLWPLGLTAQRAADAEQSVLANAGARRADADPVDTRIIDGIKKRTGRIINCVTADGSARCKMNAGGWPSLTEQKRSLTLPANHSSLTASGYTNLELWLHKMAAEVEGKAAVAPMPPLDLKVQ